MNELLLLQFLNGETVEYFRCPRIGRDETRQAGEEDKQASNQERDKGNRGTSREPDLDVETGTRYYGRWQRAEESTRGIDRRRGRGKWKEEQILQRIEKMFREEIITLMFGADTVVTVPDSVGEFLYIQRGKEREGGRERLRVDVPNEERAATAASNEETGPPHF
ncbi:hypothetical protein R1sor_001404 [Riccia sorocarpa]|uniref:Uncharacterized protein n=1 Tax=Riccia sorocarpa TaxID=122646 RepID=A0ABD3GYB1_9MARC